MAGSRYRDLDDFETNHPELGKLLRTRSHPFIDSVRAQIEGYEYITDKQLDALHKFLPSTMHPIPKRFSHVTLTAVIYGIHIDDHGRETFKWRSNSTGWNGRLEVVNLAMFEELRERADAAEHAIPVVITGQVVWLPDHATGFLIIKGEWVDPDGYDPDELDKIEHPFDVEPGDSDELLDELGAPPKGTPPPEPEGVRARLAVSNDDADWLAAIRKRGKK